MSSSSTEPAASAPSNTPNGAAASSAKAATGAAKAASEQNPALRMMGFPRMRLPSRNWMIFWTLTGSLATAIYYDKWQTKKVKEKWCKLVSSIAEEPLNVKTLPRTVTIYLSAPPGDGLRTSREHFHDYMKPILVAAAINWDVIEGRKEGDVRYKTAQSIRDRRKAAGEHSETPLEEDPITSVRKGMGVAEYTGVAGDIVVGRHTWKEYMRGVHEGWLGPLDAPPSKENEDSTLASDPPTVATTDPAADTPKTVTTVSPEDAGTDTLLTDLTEERQGSDDGIVNAEEAAAEVEKKKKEQEEVEEKPKPRFPPPYMPPEAFSTATVPRSIPEVLDPTAPISCPHILGFRNTPIRFYRYLTRRYTADEIGRQVASAVLGQSRPFSSTTQDIDGTPSTDEGSIQEQTSVLQREERDWWKTVRAPRKEHEESVLIEPISLNEQITSRMRIFQLTSADEERSKQPPALSDKE